MKILILITILFIVSISTSYAQNDYSAPTFCEWLGNAASAVAQNRDKGIEEYDLIGKYLKGSTSYGEQSVVIPLIDRVYNIGKDLNPDEIAFAEWQQCEIAEQRLGLSRCDP